MDKLWEQTHYPAKMYSKIKNTSTIKCELTPRHCLIKEDKTGFCGIRKNIGGELYTLNYGKSVHLAQEFIETEGIFHFAPGLSILSLGNIGCMLSCDYCQNWRTSQAKFVSDKDVCYYSPEEIVEIAKKHKIKILSWTYNDPVVWFEFILETAKLAKKEGLLNLFKSSLYISIDTLKELIKVIDIFSVSIKSMNSKWYKKYTKGNLEPVLEATKYIYEKRNHLEISNLMVTDNNDTEEDARLLSSWIIDNLSEKIPLHFVRFHPAHKYHYVERTSITNLLNARKIATDMGIKYCYIGNIYDHNSSSTFCLHCKNLLIARYGLTTKIVGLDSQGNCKFCGKVMDITIFPTKSVSEWVPPKLHNNLIKFKWHNDINAAHIEAWNKNSISIYIFYQHNLSYKSNIKLKSVSIFPNESWRFIVSKCNHHDEGVTIYYPPNTEIKIYEVLDRAHFPTICNKRVNENYGKTEIKI